MELLEQYRKLEYQRDTIIMDLYRFFECDEHFESFIIQDERMMYWSVGEKYVKCAIEPITPQIIDDGDYCQYYHIGCQRIYRKEKSTLMIVSDGGHGCLAVFDNSKEQL